MSKNYAFGTRTSRRQWLAAALTLGALPVAQAQTAPGWGAALATSSLYGGTATALATAADASGNVYVTGQFTGQVQLGSTLLVSTGGSDVFVAKWNALAGTWTWAVRAGGTDFDGAQAIALSGTTVYLSGYTTDNVAGSNGVAFGAVTLPGKAASASRDLFVAKLTDAGASASFGWAVAGGGTREDSGTSLAVSGTSVYVGGAFINDTNNSQAVTFGTLPLNGLSPTSSFNSDVVVGKLTDAGTAATWGWVLAAGGTDTDRATALGVNGTSVYATGNFNNSSTNANSVTFGSTTVNGQAATAGNDVFVTKITDAGSTAAFTWVQVAGGAGTDQATALAVSGTSVYTAGYFTNNSSNGSAVTFGAAGALAGATGTSSQDIFVAKLTDAGNTGTFAWARAAGGIDVDQATALVANGTALYVGGSITNDSFNNNTVSFGTLGAVNGATATTGPDALVARLTDAGTSATWGWAQVGGSVAGDNVLGLAASGSSVYPVGTFSVNASFGAAAGSPLSSGMVSSDFFVGQLTEATVGTSASWARVAQAQVGGSFAGQASATDGSGNVYVAGYFSGRVTLGTTTLTAGGGLDAFVAKWSPATNTWVWALAGGGLGADQAAGIAVSGGNVYVTGYLTESSANTNLTRFGSLTVNGAAAAASQDVFVAKIADAGTSAAWGWVQVAGGTGLDQGRAVAVNGTSLYVSGYFSNSTANGNTVAFGAASLAGLGATSGNDAFITKLTDGGSTGTFAWAVAAGGNGADRANGVAVSGSSVYVAGYFTNSAANVNTVTFGTAPLAGLGATASNDVFVTKLTDAGTSATFGWTVAGGGAGIDQANAIALNGSSVYVAGYITNNAANTNAVAFGTVALAGQAASSGNDAFVAKLTDAGASASFGWAAAGGGTSLDQALALVASGTSVYVAGYYLNTAANANAVTFGSTTLAGFGPTATPDIFLTKYTDAGSTGSVAWAQSAGSPATDQAFGLAVSGARLYLTGLTQGAPAFGTTTLANQYGAQQGFIALLNDTSSPLATAAASSKATFSLYPNPAHQTATVAGLPAGSSLQVLDMLGRAVSAATANAAGTATLALPASLSPGVYLVRSGSQALRLTVQ